MATILCDVSAHFTFEKERGAMAKAFVGGRECKVTVDRDLGESWAVTVVPPEFKRGETEFGAVIAKLQGNDRAAVLKGGLEILQKAGQIQRFELEPGDVPPPAEPAAEPPKA
jgi:hypothetical protein